jgi:hypothetical protein
MALSINFVQNTNVPPSVDERTISYYGTVSIVGSGNYVSGGIPVTSAKAVITAPLGQNTPYADRTPLVSQLNSGAGSGYQYAYNPTTQKMQIFTGAAAQSALTELSAGALPGGVTSDVIEFELIFPRI